MKIAVITGAAQGIGRSTAELRADQGYAPVLNELRSPTDTQRAAQGRGAEVLEFAGDISDEDTVGRFAGLVNEQWARVDVLVNNAGISFISPAEHVSAAEFRRVLNINLVAPFLLAKSFGAMMLAQAQAIS